MEWSPDRTVVAWWVRAVLVALAVPQLLTGAWAIARPASWFRDFPGIGPDLVAAEPPYNRHLAIDAGAGFLTVGLVLLAAAYVGRVGSCRLAVLAAVAFGTPHVIYHATLRAPGLSGAENGLSTSFLALGLGVALALGVVLRPQARWRQMDGRPQADADTDRAVRPTAVPSAAVPATGDAR